MLQNVKLIIEKTALLSRTINLLEVSETQLTMAHQQHAVGVASTGLQIDAIPTVKGPPPEYHQSEKDTPNTSGTDAAPHNVLPETSAPQIDVSEGPPMVTPLKLLQRDSRWIDCPFCLRMAKTKVQMIEKSEEPSGYV